VRLSQQQKQKRQQQKQQHQQDFCSYHFATTANKGARADNMRKITSLLLWNLNNG
jgi:hypothetical protein